MGSGSDMISAQGSGIRSRPPAWTRVGQPVQLGADIPQQTPAEFPWILPVRDTVPAGELANDEPSQPVFECG